MDFFNKLGKKTTEVYQGAKEKTVKISEEIKLKNKINDLKEKINKEYLEIGKAVYEKMKNGEDASKEEIMPRCDEISRLSEESERLHASILALKNIKKCISCGAELEVKSEFCSKCGAAQPKIEEEKIEVAEEPAEAKEVEVNEVKDAEESNFADVKEVDEEKKEEE